MLFFLTNAVQSPALTPISADATKVPCRVAFSPGGKGVAMLIAEMEQAQYRLDVAMFYLSNKSIIDTLCRLSSTHGVKIRFITDASMDTPANRPVLDRLDQCGVAVYVVTMPRQGKMHLKTALVDIRTVLTGAANWSEAADSSNHEDMLVLHSIPLATLYNKQFNDLEKVARPYGRSAQQPKSIRKSTRRLPSATRRFGVAAEAASVKAYFMPGRAFHDDLYAQLRRAKTVDIGMYLLTDRTMVETLKRIAPAARVRVIVDSLMMSGSGLAALQELWDAGIEVYSYHRDRASMHLKTVVIDQRYVWTGSANWTEGALGVNVEDMLCLQSTALAALYGAKMESLFAQGRSFEEYAITRRPESSGAIASISGIELPPTGPRKDFQNVSRTPFPAIPGRGTVKYLPDGDYQPALRRLIQTARQSIFIMMYLLPEQQTLAPRREEILNDLISAAQRGVYVYMVLYTPPSSDDRLADHHSNWAERLRARGIDVRLSIPGAAMHKKAVIVDLCKIIIGSHNWSEGALSGDRVFESSALVILEQQNPRLADLVFQRPIISDMTSRPHWEAEINLIRHLNRAKPEEFSEILERAGVE